MKKKPTGKTAGKNFKKLPLIVSIIFMAGIAVSGCAAVTKPTPPPLSIPQIVSMCKNHVPQKEIINRLRASGEVFYLNAGEIIKLHKQGVCPKVLNYMLKTGIRAKEEQAAIRGARRRWLWYNRQWYFGPPFVFGPWIGPGPYWRY